eukprot:7195530-Pyramimonas_sp.AAC.1
MRGRAKGMMPLRIGRAIADHRRFNELLWPGVPRRGFPPRCPVGVLSVSCRCLGWFGGASEVRRAARRRAPLGPDESRGWQMGVQSARMSRSTLPNQGYP